MIADLTAQIGNLSIKKKIISDENEILKQDNAKQKINLEARHNEIKSLNKKLDGYNHLVKEIRDRSDRYRTDREVASWLELIIIQSEIAVNETVQSSQSLLNSIHEGIKRKWISKVYVYGVNNRYKAGIRLSINVDWLHEEATFSCMTYLDGYAAKLNLRQAVSSFRSFVSTNKIFHRFMIVVEYVDPAESDFYNKQLNLEKCAIPEWVPKGDYSFLGCFFILAIVILIIFNSLNSVHSPAFKTDQIYWQELHKAIPRWDKQTARSNIDSLIRSSNKCYSDFASELKNSIALKDSEGFRDVNLIKRELNQKLDCNFEIIPYEFSP